MGVLVVQHLQNVVGGPRECLRVESLEAWKARARTMRVDLGLGPVLRESPYPIPAHVSDGRWVFDCPCGSAGLASHEWGVGICVDCGVIHQVSFPAARETAEAVLLARPNVLNRHFFPAPATAARRSLAAPETVLSIARENRRRGVPVVKREGTDGVD